MNNKVQLRDFYADKVIISKSFLLIYFRTYYIFN